MIIIGGGVIGIEYALMFATLGVTVTVVDSRENLLGFCDAEIIEHLMYYARSMGIRFRLGEQVEAVKHLEKQGEVAVQLKSRKVLVADSVFFSVGRVGDVGGLNLEAAGLTADARGKIQCNENYETEVTNIYAVGDVIGFPSLASTSLEQGRNAVLKMYSLPCESSSEIPYGLYTIPEIAMVGSTEQELTEKSIPYDTGIARFEELAKPHIIGNPTGMLKLLYHRDTHELLGVHCIGDCAIEVIHLGQAVMHFGGTIDYFCQSVFNHPSISEAYKIAAFDGINRNHVFEDDGGILESDDLLNEKIDVVAQMA
jgi:NAD(P) transhydrogenase